MALLKTIVREIAGLFVDDGLLAAAILVVIGGSAWVVNKAWLDEAAAGALFGGCLLVLMLSVVRAACSKVPARRDRKVGEP